jgi:hypothetical protein
MALLPRNIEINGSSGVEHFYENAPVEGSRVSGESRDDP